MNLISTFWLVLALALSIAVATLLIANKIRGTSVEQADRLAITEVMARYALYWDDKDARQFANLFTEDAVLELWADGDRRSRTNGRASIYDYAKRSHGGRLADRQTRHHLSPPVFIELNANTAVTDQLVLITHQTLTQGRAEISGSGRYRIAWRKTDDGWQIAERTLNTDNRPL
ncbi:MAG: nuclear transport factor 2 family protein [Pseudomonadota bacterium]